MFVSFENILYNQLLSPACGAKMEKKEFSSTNMQKPKTAAIVPAFNEEATIGNVLRVLLAAKELDEVIVVNDGSTDKTAEISLASGVRIVVLPQRKGKGNAMREGAKHTSAQIIAFFDADLIGLSPEHISQLINPILKQEAKMVIGVRERLGKIPSAVIKIDPLLAIGGERALKRSIFENLPQKFTQNFAIEMALNYYCQVNKFPVSYVKLKGLNIVIKERKLGLLKGFWERLKMTWQLIKIRFSLLSHKREFQKL